jgi:hypothetical protein
MGMTWCVKRGGNRVMAIRGYDLYLVSWSTSREGWVEENVGSECSDGLPDCKIVATKGYLQLME